MNRADFKRHQLWKNLRRAASKLTKVLHFAYTRELAFRLVERLSLMQMPLSFQGHKFPRLRGLLRSAAPYVAVGLACAPGHAAEPVKPGALLTNRPAKSKSAVSPASSPVLSPKEDAERVRDQLKPLQETTSGPPPLAPSIFSPEPDKNFLPFPASLLFPAIETTFVPRVTLSSGTPPAVPDKFTPDPRTGPTAPFSFVGEASGLQLKVTRTVQPAPKTPPQFNPDPGVKNSKPIEEPFFKPEFTLGPPFGSEPVPAPLALPRVLLRDTEVVAVPPRAPSGFGSEPVAFTLPRAAIRTLTVEPQTAESKAKYGLDKLPRELDLPRANTRRNLPFHPHFESSGIARDTGVALPPNTESANDRWRTGFLPWKRYANGSGEDPFYYHEPRLWHPYYQSVLKGDLPVIGQDIFLNVTVNNSTDFSGQVVPTPSGASAAKPGQYEFFGRGEALSVQNNMAFAVELFRGETVFKPVEWAIKLTPVYNINYLHVQETGGVSPDPRGFLGGGPGNNFANPSNAFVTNPADINTLLAGQLTSADSLAGRRSTVRTKDYWALQEAFIELHLRDLTDSYDFIAIKGGNQTFNSDFRGFLFNDTNLGGRIFGNYANNRLQYNAAVFDMREKDTNSGLNTFEQRNQRVVIANAYLQDTFFKGYTTTWSFHANLDDADIHYDRNGGIVRPTPIGTVRPHDVRAYYLGFGGDGHIGRWNVSHQFYHAFGRDDFNGLAGQPVNINAQFAALELSYDRDWVRYKASFVYASGDSKADDGKATGFDTILDNPNFVGGPFSYYVRQGFNFGGTAVGLKQGGSLVPNLRTSKAQGQANFVNPGIYLWGLGTDMDVTPKLKAFVNLNYIRFAETDPLRTALLTDKIDRELGLDLSLGLQYRPFLTDNVILSAGWGVLLPGRGYKDIYRRSTDPVPGLEETSRAGKVDDFLYSGLIALTLTY